MNWRLNFTRYVKDTVASVTTVTPVPLLGSSCYATPTNSVTSVTAPDPQSGTVTHVTQPVEAPLQHKASNDAVVTGVTVATQENTRPSWDCDPVLEALCADLDPEDAQALRDERAGILEYEAGFSLGDAETRSGLFDLGVA